MTNDGIKLLKDALLCQNYQKHLDEPLLGIDGEVPSFESLKRELMKRLRFGFYE